MIMQGDPPQVDRFLNAMTGRRAYDIGANQGGYARGMAARFDEVIACEPAIESYEVLTQIGWPNIVALNIAVTNHNGKVTLNVQSESIKSGQLTTDSGGQGLEHETWGAKVDTRTVPARTLDSLVEQYGPPSLVKVDVEGHDVQVIEGGLASIEEHRPALYVEIHHGGFGDRIRELIGDWYPDLTEVKHPHYPRGHWGFDNHYWLIAGDQS